MKQKVSVSVKDKVIAVDNVPLFLEFSAPSGMRALQWNNGSGHIEWEEGLNTELKEADFASQVAPFVALWEEKKSFLEKKELERVEAYNSKEAKSERIRSERNYRLRESDYLILSDYPLPSEIKKRVTAYRQALRDLTEQAGFPWSGDVNAPDVPWPAAPALSQEPEMPDPDPDDEIIVPEL